jgi:hypothetical protein
MEHKNEHLWSTLKSQLSEAELNHAVVYLMSTTLSEGSKLDLPEFSITVPWQSQLAFVDREPLANYAHSCRYILVNTDTGKIQSMEARFPPFAHTDKNSWFILYKAPEVPDTVLAV